VWVKAGQDKRPEGIAGGDKSARRSGVTVEAVHTERAEILRCTRLPTRAVRGDWTTTTPRRPHHTRVQTNKEPTIVVCAWPDYKWRPTCRLKIELCVKNGSRRSTTTNLNEEMRKDRTRNTKRIHTSGAKCPPPGNCGTRGRRWRHG